MLTQNWIVSSTEMVFMSCFLTAIPDINQLPTIWLTPKSKICFVIIVVHTDFIKTLITWIYFFLLAIFFFIAVSTSCIAVLKTVEKITIGEVDAGFSLTSSYLLNEIFFSVIYSFSFWIRRHNIRLTNSFEDPRVGFCLSWQVARTLVLIGLSKDIYSLSSYLNVCILARGKKK